MEKNVSKLKEQLKSILENDENISEETRDKLIRLIHQIEELEDKNNDDHLIAAAPQWILILIEVAKFLSGHFM